MTETAQDPFEVVSVPETESETTLRKQSSLRWLIGYSAIYGAMSMFLPEESPVNSLLGLPFLLLALRWCYADADEHNYRVPTVMKLLLFFLFVVAFPIHIFLVHGTQGLKVLGKAFLVFVAMMTMAVLAGTGIAVVGEFTGISVQSE